MNRTNTIIAFVLISVFLVIGAVSLNYNLSPLFDSVDESIQKGHTVVMNGEIDAVRLENVLLEGGYVADEKDARYISTWYTKKIKEEGPLENLGEINTNKFKIPADSILEYGGKELQTRLEADLIELGQDEQWRNLDKNSLSTVFGREGGGNALIRAYVGEDQSGKMMGILPKKDKKNVEGVVVRITEHWINDSVASLDPSLSAESKTIGYAVTDKNGIASFYVPKGKFYSVLPIAPGFQFGQEKGTTEGPLNEDLDLLSFTQTQHKLKPFRSDTYSQLKKDRALISRSPAEFRHTLFSDVAIFIICWFVVFIATSVADKRQSRKTDSAILVSLMALCAIGFLTLYGQMIPLSDIMNAHKMIDVTSLRADNFSGGMVLGCMLLIILSCFDYVKFYQKWTLKWNKGKNVRFGFWRSIGPGLPFLIFAILLMVLLRLAGSGPEGSDARVNLFGVQPSEMVKYFIVFFLAFFFVAKGDVIKTYGERLTLLARRRYVFVVGSVLIIIAAISLIYLVILKDMGPGIVLLATFILMYSVVRRDTPQLLLGIISYMVVVGSAYILSPSTGVRGFAMLGWLILWIGYSWHTRKTIYESAIFFNLLVSLFLIGGALIRPFSGAMADRLLNRTNMAWSGIFNNAVPQGDQIAQGLWGTASGGFSGMGLGGGSSHFIPAGHTDLILNSLGEQMGWLGILIVAVCFYILISRTATAAQYSGNKFTFYLCLGMGLLMGVQFLFIALGSVGAIPLSGVPVPFLSYSGTSIVMALAAYGVVISVSRHKGSREALRSFVETDATERKDNETLEARSISNSLFAGMLIFFIGIICVVAFNGYYQLYASETTQLRPAITSTSEGLRVLEYNPRIGQIMDMLDRGNIYDRNGVLLATSDKSEIEKMAQYPGIGELILQNLEDLEAKRLKRYYPFGAQTVFMVGDANYTTAFANYGSEPLGYFAENRHAGILRGFDTNPQKMEIPVENFKFHRFLNPVSDTLVYSIYDYTALLPALSTSVYKNPWIDQFNASRNKRDIYLTIDAVLQTRLQNKMEEYIRNNDALNSLADLRASVVILDAKSGDLLTSSNYPLPNAGDILNLRDLHLDRKMGAPSEWIPELTVTERDLGLTYRTAPGSTAKVMTAMAGFKKLGEDAYDKGYEIKPYMTVESPNKEPNTSVAYWNRNGGKKTFMENAIKYSSNCYFVMLLNEEDLYPQLGDIYWTVGASLARRQPYFFSFDEYTDEARSGFNKEVRNFQSNGLADYKKYMEREPLSETWNANSRRDRMSSIQEYTGIAWGQSQLEATPLAMARVAGIVGNGGVLMPTRYLLKEPKSRGTRVLDINSTTLLASAMNEESSKHIGRNLLPSFPEGTIGGKTGTPMRNIRDEKNMPNDGWYICYISDTSNDMTLAIAIRLERLDKGGSPEAVRFLSKVVIPVLQESGYINKRD